MKKAKARKFLNRIVTAVLAATLCVTAFPAVSKTAQAAQTSSGCVTIAMDGEYVSGAAAAVKRINQIRYEACKKGYMLDGKKLTLKDYVPIKWSAGLEKIARIRAAESSVTMAHARLNGKAIFEFTYPSDSWFNSELIAWNGTDSMAMAIEQWYREKADYLAGGSIFDTGHYMAMISPGNRYVGIGTFLSDTAPYHNTTVAQFLGVPFQSQKAAKATGKCSTKVEVKKDKITAVKMTGKQTLDRAQKAQFTLRAVLGKYDKKTSYKLLSGVKWSSSNSSVATVSSAGVVTGLKKGKTKITATLGSKSASYVVTVSGKCVHAYTGKVIKAATASNAGRVLHTCSVCGNKKYIDVKALKNVSLKTTSYKYDGKAKTPSVVVKDTSGAIVSPKCYTVTYPKDRTKAGTYSVIITFNGRYSGTYIRKFNIVK